MFRVGLASLVPAMVALALVLGVAVALVEPDAASGQAPFELAIDADVENGDGPCNPVDDEASVEAGSVHRVAVCLTSSNAPPTAFLTRVLYDGDLNMVPEGPHVLPALDDNPDANAGETTFSSPNLGERWDCTGLGIFPPRGDDEHTPEKVDAVLACYADLRDPDATLAGGGPLEVVTFEAVGEGDDHIEFDPETQIGDALGAIGRCGADIPNQQIPCRGAVIHKGEGDSASEEPASPSAGSPEASPAASPTEELSTEAGPGAETPPTSETVAESDDGGGFPWAALGGGIGGFVVLVAIAGGLYYWRRSSGPAP